MSITTPNGAVELCSGDRVRDWLIIDQLGSGGTASVYRVVRADRPSDPAGQRALRICRPANRQHLDAIVSTYSTMPDHSAVVAVDETFIHHANGHAHVVCLTELSDGGNLEQQLDRSVLGPDDARILSWQLIDGLEAFHSAGLVHGDVKPSNIMLFDGIWKLVDPSATSRSRRHATSSVVAHERTLRYVAPEMLDRPGVARRAGDVWALGVTLHESLTGSPPFDSMADQVIANCRIARDVPEDLARLITNCVTSVEERPKTAGALRESLRPARPTRWSSKRLAGVAGTTLVIAAVGAVVVASTRPQPLDTVGLEGEESVDIVDSEAEPVDIVDFEVGDDVELFAAADGTTPTPSLIDDGVSTRLVAGASGVTHTYYLAGRDSTDVTTVQADLRLTYVPNRQFGAGGPVYGLIVKTIPSESNPTLDAYMVTVSPGSDGVRVRIGVVKRGAGWVDHHFRSPLEGHSEFADELLFPGVTNLDTPAEGDTEPQPVELGYWQLSASAESVEGETKIVAHLKDPSGTSKSIEWIDQGEKASIEPGSVGIATYGMWSIDPRIDNFVVSDDR